MAKALTNARDKFLENFQKSYGQTAISKVDKLDLKAIPTGSIALDRAMTSGGYMFGRVTEVWGPPDGGKTSLVSVGVANAQLVDSRDVCWVNAEHTFDPVYARSFGVDTDRLFLVDPLSAENVADMVKDAIRSDVISTVVIDSVGAILTNKEFEKTAEESDMGKRAQVVSRMINIAIGLALRHNVALIVINQARANFSQFGAPVKQSGGFVLAHSSTHRLQVKRAKTYSDGTGDDERNVGFEMGVKVERSKVGPQGSNVKFDFYTQPTEKYGAVGIDKAQEAMIIGIRDGVIKQGGAWYTLPNGERFQGGESVKEYLRQNPKMIDDIREKIVSQTIQADFKADDSPELTDEMKKELIS